MRNTKLLLFLGISVLLFASCGKEKSATTGWRYNDTKWGGFEKSENKEQETGPNLVFVKGGTFTMGQMERDVNFELNTLPRKVTVQSFYMDKTEVSNLHYREYLYWLEKIYTDYPQVYQDHLPDTFCWREKLAYNEPMVRYYLRHASYQDYPVVGVSWVQATDFSAWRTDRVNEMILIRDGYQKTNPDQANEDNFNTEAYLVGQYEGIVKKQKKSYSGDSKGRNITMDDGIFLPDYTLPTEAQWEYAARSEIGNAINENVNERKIYSWTGLSMRVGEDGGKYRGKMNANYKRGRGDYMGLASDLNDAASIPTEVVSYWPNDYGLYNMSGNVSEWVQDVYRPLSFEDVEDMNSFRGNVFKTVETDADGMVAEKDSLGKLRYRNVTLDENKDRTNYKVADNIGYLDPESFEGGAQRYDYGKSSLVNDKARVYKGGSWNDRAYYTSPATRRFLDEKRSLKSLGFRCAMIRVGSE